VRGRGQSGRGQSRDRRLWSLVHLVQIILREPAWSKTAPRCSTWDMGLVLHALYKARCAPAPTWAPLCTLLFASCQLPAVHHACCSGIEQQARNPARSASPIDSRPLCLPHSPQPIARQGVAGSEWELVSRIPLCALFFHFFLLCRM
jgi:hypothetical protein